MKDKQEFIDAMDIQQDEDGHWFVNGDVGYVEGDVEWVQGSVVGNVVGNVEGSVEGDIWGNVEGIVGGKIDGRESVNFYAKSGGNFCRDNRRYRSARVVAVGQHGESPHTGRKTDER